MSGCNDVTVGECADWHLVHYHMPFLVTLICRRGVDNTFLLLIELRFADPGSWPIVEITYTQVTGFSYTAVCKALGSYNLTHCTKCHEYTC